jgi:MSHA biogenesis protein MshP
MFHNMNVFEMRASKRQHGSSLVAAIFLLVVIAGLGVFMLSIYSAQQRTSSMDVRGARAYQAAKAGIEWGSYQIMLPENSSPTLAPYNCVGAMGTPTFAGSLQGYSVSVSCSQTTTTEGNNTIRVYQITATASAGAAPAPDFVERQMTGRIATCRVGPGNAAICT